MLSPVADVVIVIRPLVSPPLFVKADDLRTIAESGCDPRAYEAAARAFDDLGMIASAQRMRDRANHYRSLS